MSQVSLSISDSVASITLNNPPLNTMTFDTLREIAEHIGQANAKACRAIVVRSGIDGVFSAGIDPAFAIALSNSERLDIFKSLAHMLNAHLRSEAPIIADINGSALAGGAVLGFAADFMIASKEAKISFSELKVGLPIPAAIHQMVADRLHPGLVREVLLLGKNVDAETALKNNIVQGIYSSEEERAKLRDSLLGRIARLPRQSVAYAKSQMNQGLIAVMQEFEDDPGEFAKYVSDEFLGKGLRAVLKGESPRF